MRLGRAVPQARSRQPGRSVPQARSKQPGKGKRQAEAEHPGKAPQRGEIWWAALAAPKGSEPGYRRPVVVVQSDAFNRSRIQTVIVAVITSNLRLTEAPGNLSLSRSQSGLPKESVVNVSQLITLDRSVLTQRIKRLPTRQLAALDDGLRLVLALTAP